MVRSILLVLAALALPACGGSVHSATDDGGGPDASGSSDAPGPEAPEADVDASTAADAPASDAVSPPLDATTDAKDAGPDGPQLACTPAPPDAGYDGGPPLTGITRLLDHAFDNGVMCAVESSGTVVCWGDNYWGQLGTGSTQPQGSDVPVVATQLTSPVTALTATYSSVCAVTASGASCWGENGAGELGHATGTAGDMTCGMTQCNTQPLPVAGLPAGTPLLAGGDNVACAIAGGTLACWGTNNVGQLGLGALDQADAGEHYAPSTAIPAGALDVSVGSLTTCALTKGGSVSCWGWNEKGELGHPPSTGGDVDCGGAPCNPTPTAVPGISGALAVTVGGSGACAIMGDESVTCWGESPQGSPAPPTTIAGLAGVTQVTMNDACSCALRTDGTVACWGLNQLGCLGVGCSDLHLYGPMTVPGLTGVVQIAAARSSTCALLGDGRVACWGDQRIGNGDPSEHAESPAFVVAP